MKTDWTQVLQHIEQSLQDSLLSAVDPAPPPADAGPSAAVLLERFTQRLATRPNRLDAADESKAVDNLLAVEEAALEQWRNNLASLKQQLASAMASA